jgi:sialate O-acetylesterase
MDQTCIAIHPSEKRPNRLVPRHRHVLCAKHLTIWLMGCLGWNLSLGEVRLPQVFSSHMVLQQQQPVILWGWAEPGERVEVTLAGLSAQTQANARGEWKVTLNALPAGGPHVLGVKASNSLKFEDVMIGEVWLCSGQSNMEMGLGVVQDGKEEIAGADDPQIRLLMVPNKWTPEPRRDVEPTEWKVCSPKTIAEGGWGGFSAAAYFFGRELRRSLGDVAIGLIDATWGGTRIESWTPPEGFAAVASLQAEHERVQLRDPSTDRHQEKLGEVLQQTARWLEIARQARAKREGVPAMPQFPPELLPPANLQEATALYNGMIHPLHPLGIRGAIWYQGESNLSDGGRYTDRMQALVGGWREVWNRGAFPFYFVQIAPFDYGGEAERLAVLWEAQAAAAQSIPNSGMVVINDIGDLKDIHPPTNRKWAAAWRFGLWPKPTAQMTWFFPARSARG